MRARGRVRVRTKSKRVNSEECQAQRLHTSFKCNPEPVSLAGVLLWLDNKKNKPMTKKPHPVDVHVGSRVRLRRMLLGMSQEKLGERLGLTFQQVQKYEKGANRIGASRLYEISRILDVPVSHFFEDLPSHDDKNGKDGKDGFSESATVDFMAETLTSPEGLQMMRSFYAIREPKVRRRIVDLVAALSESKI